MSNLASKTTYLTAFSYHLFLDASRWTVILGSLVDIYTHGKYNDKALLSLNDDIPDNTEYFHL